MQKVKIGNFLTRNKTAIDIADGIFYKRITIRLYHKWVSLRDTEKWEKILTKKQFIVKKWQFIVSKIDARNWAFGIVWEDVDDWIITWNFWVFDVNKELIDINRFNEFVQSAKFNDICERASSWATNRKYLDESKFLNYEIDLPNLENQVKSLWTIGKFKNQFDKLYFHTNSWLQNIKSLRQSILSDAIAGKLVPQDPIDEPASVLLSKIQAEKAQLIADKKIKKSKPLSSITEDEKPFELPQWWEWVRFWEITHLITDGTHHTPTYTSEWVPFLSVKDVAHGFINFENTRFIGELEHLKLKQRCNPEYWDILLTKVWTTWIAKIIDIEREFSIFVSVALIKFPKDKIYWLFLENCINSPFIREQSEKGTAWIWNKNLVLRKIEDFLLPLPPLAEQHRIVTKVEQLMTLCDQLEAQITDTQSQGKLLMEAVMQQAMG